MVVIPERASQRNNFHIIPLSRPRIERDRDDERTAIARTLWSQGIDPRGTPAEDYLRSRGLTPTDAARKALRFHPHPKYPAGWGPTLLAAFRLLETDEITAVHRIRVDQPARWPNLHMPCEEPWFDSGGQPITDDEDFSR